MRTHASISLRPRYFEINTLTERPLSPTKKYSYYANLRLFLGKLRSRWDGPFIVTQVFPHGAVGIQNPTNGNTLKVNGQKLKHFVINFVDEQMIVTIDVEWATLYLAEDIKLSAYWKATQFCRVWGNFWAKICAIASPHVCSFQDGGTS